MDCMRASRAWIGNESTQDGGVQATKARGPSGESARAETKGNRSRSATADSLDEADVPREATADLDGGDGGDGDFEDAGGNFDSECTADP